ncbi:MAG: GbsR/MarR family transcriptional regulator [Planctomycetota bacterium]
MSEASERMERRILHVCNAAGTLVEYWGFKSIMGRVWTLLALHPEPLPQVEVADRLGVSRSLVSGTITELQRYGLVKPTDEHRNAPYVAVLDVWPAITDVLRTREWMFLESARQALEAAIEEAQDGRSGPYSIERMRLLHRMLGAVQRLLGLVIAVRRPDVVQSVREWVSGVSELIDLMRQV